MARIRMKRCGPGRPRTRPARVIGDKGHSSRKIRTYLRKRGIACTVPERVDQEDIVGCWGAAGGTGGREAVLERVRNVRWGAIVAGRRG